MPRTKPAYAAEFKAEAVRLYKQTDKSMKEVTDDLGMSVNSLREWLRRSETEADQPRGQPDNEQEELHRLRKEVRILREEREILKEATTKEPSAASSIWSSFAATFEDNGMIPPAEGSFSSPRRTAGAGEGVSVHRAGEGPSFSVTHLWAFRRV